MKHKLIIIILILPLMVNLLVFNSAEFIAGASTIRVTGVSLDVETLHFDSLGSTQMLIPDIRPMNATNQNIVFTIANENVAQVNESGVVTAVSNGTTLVTVTTEDGDFSASALVNVQSHFIEIFEVNLDADSYNNYYQLLNRDTHSLEVIVYPFTNMLDVQPVIRFNHNGVVNVAAFSEPIVEDNKATFTTSLTPNRIGTIIATISILEGATNREIHRSIPINVNPNPEEGLRFMFNGATYGEGEEVVTMRRRVPLNVNINDVPGLEFSLTPFNTYSYEVEEQEYNVMIYYIDNQYYLDFLRDYKVRLYFRTALDDLGECFVYIRSTFGRLDFDVLEETLDNIPDIDIISHRRSGIIFDVTPSDFELYYRVVWSSSSNLAIQRITTTNILFTANTHEVNKSFIRVSFINQKNEEVFHHYFDVTVSHLGVCDIRFLLNDDDGNPIGRGYEQTHVFGNRRSDDNDFTFEVGYTTMALPGRVLGVTFHSNNTQLATVNASTVTFNRNFNFGNNDRAKVTITATSRYPDITGEYATTSFVFIVINAADVSNFEEFDQANIEGLNMVLRDSIDFPKTWSPYYSSYRLNTIQGSLHGNGHTMNASDILDNVNSSTHLVFNFLNIANFRNNNETIVTNTVFSGFSDSMDTLERDNVNPYMAMQNRGRLVQLGSNITFQYNRLQRANVLLNIRVDSRVRIGDEAYFTNRNTKVINNVFSESGTAGIFLGESHHYLRATTVGMQFGNLIFERTLFGIFFQPERIPEARPFLPDNTRYGRLEFSLIEDSFLRFYNWIPKSTFNGIKLSVSGHQVSLADQNFDRKEIDGQYYFSIGFIQPELFADLRQIDPRLQPFPPINSIIFASKIIFNEHAKNIIGVPRHYTRQDFTDITGGVLRYMPILDDSQINKTQRGSYFDVRTTKLTSTISLGQARAQYIVTTFTPGVNSPFFVSPHARLNLDLIRRGA